MSNFLKAYSSKVFDNNVNNVAATSLLLFDARKVSFQPLVTCSKLLLEILKECVKSVES